MILRDKVCIVSGGSRGIGRAIVEEFARQGADIAFTFLKSEEKALQLKKDVERLGRRALVFKNDELPLF